MSAVSLCGNPGFLLTTINSMIFFPLFLSKFVLKYVNTEGVSENRLASTLYCVCIFISFFYIYAWKIAFFFSLSIFLFLHSWLRDKMKVSGVLQCWSLPLQRWPRKHSDSQMADCWVGRISGCPSVPRVLLEEACWLLWLLRKPWYCIPIYSFCLSP